MAVEMSFDAVAQAACVPVRKACNGGKQGDSAQQSLMVDPGANAGHLPESAGREDQGI
jgi:hypothetical protein